MNKPNIHTPGRYNKAWAAGLSQAIVQVAASFLTLDPEIEQAIGVMLTGFIVWLVPNQESKPGAETAALEKRKSSQLPSLEDPLIAHMPWPGTIAALAFAVMLGACSTLLDADTFADRTLGKDCGSQSRVFRAQLVLDGISTAYPSIDRIPMEAAVAAMAAAAGQDRPIDGAARQFKTAVFASLLPIIDQKRPATPTWVMLTRIPGLTAIFAQSRSQMAEFCKSGIA